MNLRNRELALKEQQLALERERMVEQRRQWEYNAARAALNYLPDLQKVMRNKALDNEDKIWAATDICFGKDGAFRLTRSATQNHTPAIVGAPPSAGGPSEKRE